MPHTNRANIGKTVQLWESEPTLHKTTRKSSQTQGEGGGGVNVQTTSLSTHYWTTLQLFSKISIHTPFIQTG